MEARDKMSIPNYQPLNVESLGKPIHVIRDKLESLISSSCNNLTFQLQSWLKSCRIETSVNAVSLHSFSNNEMEKNATSTFQHNAGGKVFVHCDKATLIKLADCFYGASIDRAEQNLSNSDLRLQDRIGQQVTQWLAPQEMWANGEFELAFGTGLYVKIDIQLDDHCGSLHIKLDEQLVNTLTEQLDLQPNESLYDSFCQSLAATPVKLNVLLSQKRMPLSDLLSLQANDILPIELLSTVPVSIGDQHLFNGSVAEKEGQLVLIINHDKEPLS
ncbi:FliM/FliN family flagellar motor switch protein [Vibrio brasiliensis]|jgi:flagellar motor switch protein FliM|uniref:Putative flagellar motor switch protein n=1 Tax=Vibrio brasiliensis LMG 20546 TaxID=945543 RepID=E8LU57_9VIBR|nr:flagellar motor switch protein FliM [Vibrio brasiliensis]EGA65722.1 putative flagellar motor switch protein [Vibrio brasiliensis LMG 20546]MCG9647025.1 FliM/FliN family flagellar motor switch protein [Vibrio brasiliensis]MCG9725911.1 FliM/FliN family flagellar motor switch protein [Vibrio brasiliensis]MCG9751406.1 FliM/FliN family flagellar motor switch protein [Vibrio brasiliensis]MCG9781183.1 FliM/FliN family flagellar motor switch protein [Vibrio brasiliensis]